MAITGKCPSCGRMITRQVQGRFFRCGSCGESLWSNLAPVLLAAALLAPSAPARKFLKRSLITRRGRDQQAAVVASYREAVAA